MALHTGAAQVRPGEYTSGEYLSGLTLSRVSRLLSAGHGGQVLLSKATRDLLACDLPEGAGFKDLGEHRLKGLSQPERIYQLLHPDLCADFPPLTTLDVHLNNLPLQLTSFVGRELEIKTIKKLLSTSRLVTLTGSGGVGKTRLALAVAQEVMGWYQNGAVFIALASIQESGLLPARIAQELGLKESGDQSAREILCNFLPHQDILLLLDNFEHLLPSAPLLTDLLLVAPGLHLLVTSQSPLHLSGETVLTIRPLQLPDTSVSLTENQTLRRIAHSDAVRLFVNRAKARHPAFRLGKENSRQVAEICYRLDGLPLAIELAASRVREFPLALLQEELSERLDLLRGGRGLRDLPDRQQTLRSAFDWSFSHLESAEQNLFPRLGAFYGGFTLDAVVAVCTPFSRNDLLPVIGGLIDKNMIFWTEAGQRYNLLQTAQDYALERLETSAWSRTVRQAHLAYFTQIVEKAAPHLWDKEQGEWLQRLAIEIDNLRAALRWALDRDAADAEEVDLGARMAASLWYFWYLFGALREGQSWLAAALNRLPQSNQTRARLLMGSGTLTWQQGKLQIASSFLRESIDLFRSLEDRPGLAEATHMYGHIVFDQQNYQDAGSVFRESLSIYELLGDSAIRIALIGDLGLVACHQGDLSSARKYYEESLALYIQNGIKDGQAQSYLRLGDIARLEGDYKIADDFYQNSLEINRELKISLEIASSLHKLGFTALYRGEIPRAQALFRESLALQHEFGNQQGMAECFAGLASVGVSSEKYEEAARCFGAASQILTQTGLPMAPADLVEWQRDEAAARSSCDPGCFERAWMRGMKEPLEDVVISLITS